MKKFIITGIIFWIFSNSLFAIEHALILLGPPGSGKGTQSHLLKQSLGWPIHKAAGFIQAENVVNSETRAIYAQYIKGHHESTEIFKTGLMVGNLAGVAAESIILDSWPRTKISVAAFAGMIDKKNILIIELVVQDKLLIERVSYRKQCANCGMSYGKVKHEQKDNICDACGGALLLREHDNAVDFARRLARYREKQAAFHEAFDRRGIEIHKVEAAGLPSAIHAHIMKLVSAHFSVTAKD